MWNTFRTWDSSTIAYCARSSDDFPPAGHGNLPLQSPDALAVASVLPLISMVRSQEVASALAPAAVDRWHQHVKMFMMFKINPFGEVPMTPGAQQKLLV